MKDDLVTGCPVPRGILVAIGGHENKGEAPEKKTQEEHPNPLEILKTVIELSGKKPIIEVITTASSNGEELFKEYKEAFACLRVKTVNHIHHNIRKEVFDNPYTDRIEQADILFFSGGDQLKLTSLYGGSPVLLQLKRRYIKDPVVIAGTSAGAMALSTPMIYAGNQDVQEMTGEIKITTGLEFLKDVCIDTHFVDRNRFVRMAQVIGTNPTCIGIGIEEDTAMIVREGRKAEVIGSGVIVVLEGFDIMESNILDYNTKEVLTLQNLQMHLFSRGSIYQIPLHSPPHL